MRNHKINTLTSGYFNWLYEKVTNSQYAPAGSYRLLLGMLHDIDFVAVLNMDENRASDGIELRYQFGNEKDVIPAEIAYYIDKRPASVLEVLIGLAERYEIHILGDPSYGNRCALWFWSMIENLGLDEMEDSCFDPEIILQVITKFLNREYEKNGRGGAFYTTQNCDMRTIELWYQFSIWYGDVYG